MDVTVAKIVEALFNALGDKGIDAVTYLDLRAQGARGGELSTAILLIICKLRAKDKNAVRFDSTTLWTLPEGDTVAPSLGEALEREGVAFDLSGMGGLHGECA